MNTAIFNNLVSFSTPAKVNDEEYKISFQLNKNNAIFKGHFPNQPILPGVVMIEITKRAAQLVINKELKLVSARNFKFLKVIDPNVINNADLNLRIAFNKESWKVKAQIIFNDEIYFKADAVYTAR